MRGRQTSRDDDERLLMMLRCRCRGWAPTQIARSFGGTLSGPNVDTLLSRVRDADLKESGEPAEIVMQSYWKPMRNRK